MKIPSFESSSGFVFLLACAASAALSGCAADGSIGSLAGTGKQAPGAAIGTQPGATTPPSVENATSTVAIAAGGFTTCVKNANEEARCWGDNSGGALGIGDLDPGELSAPTAPVQLGRVVGLAAGEKAQCALRSGGRLYCWGVLALEWIAAGGGSSTGENRPIPLVTPLDFHEIIGEVAAVAVGRYFTCALGVAGDVRCFGQNDRGQLGLGNTDGQSLPTTLAGFDAPVTSIAASMGGLFACATTSLGSVYCWGDNDSGQIGGATSTVMSPAKIPGLEEKAVQVVAGGAHACARLESGAVACWGRGTEGQLGDKRGTSTDSPVLVDITDVTSIAAGSGHTCAVRSEGSVFCWGASSEGQAGDGPDPKRPWLVLPGSFSAKYVSCGLAHSCAWGDGGRVECWGANSRAQLGPKKTTL